MDTLLSLLLLLFFICAGYFLEKYKLVPFHRAVNPLFSIVLYLLLFFMGLKLGQNRQLLDELPTIGTLAICGAIFSVAGTIALHLLLRPLYARLDKDNLYALHMASVTGGRDMAKLVLLHLKTPCLLVLLVITGGVVGWFLPVLPLSVADTAASWTLNLLVFIVGIQMRGSGIDLKKAVLQPEALLLPVVTIAGTLIGVLAVKLIFPILPLGKVLALGGGFGWYSLSGVLISNMGDPVLGTAAFLANMLREIMALLLISFLGFTGRCESGIGTAGATSMDVTLPLIGATYGAQTVPLAFVHGVILTIVIPFIIPLFMNIV